MTLKIRLKFDTKLFKKRDRNKKTRTRVLEDFRNFLLFLTNIPKGQIFEVKFLTSNRYRIPQNEKISKLLKFSKSLEET
jgi:hypothetical protein